jgi:hypothetical protein
MDTTLERRAEGRGGAAQGERTLVSLFMDLWRETSTLVHDEVELARAEVSEKVNQVGSGIAGVAVAGAILFGGFLLLLGAAVNGLALVLPPDAAPWLAPLIVGAIVMLVGLIALSRARAHLQARNLKPERTLESLRRDRDLVKEHVK